ncbi:glycoside hydrolase family 127 protein [Planctomycetota bacterium]
MTRGLQIDDGFWGRRLRTNREVSIFHQWEQLERSGCIDNFRVAAGITQAPRRGFFYSDSDAHKWAEAASTILAERRDSRLVELLNGYIELIEAAQTSDGYLFTYNQILFPRVRWHNLQIEHELYTLGHLIEAGVAHHEATGSDRLLRLARKGADLAVRDFAGPSPLSTPGHQETEIALVRLYRATGARRYLDLARSFLERRGRTPLFGAAFLRQLRSQLHRSRAVRKKQGEDPVADALEVGVDLTGNLTEREPPFIKLRALLSFLTGRYQQQHAPLRAQTVPVGHAVRWTYQACAAAMVARETDDRRLLHVLERAWDHMVERRMYVSGGIGSLPVIEAFGRDYELDPHFAYCETCAALGSIFWSREMLSATRKAPFADLIEWQLYNAAGVGMGKDGRSYLYRNPLASRGGLRRRPWFDTPCCPSNLSRTWGSLGAYVAERAGNTIWVNQYVGGEIELPPTSPGEPPVAVRIRSDLPWDGDVVVEVATEAPAEITVLLRLPSWADKITARVDGERMPVPPAPKARDGAAGYSPCSARWLHIARAWSGDSRITLTLGMPVTTRRAHPRVRSSRGKVALTRGPLVYCLESIDNPEASIPHAELDLSQPISVRRSRTHPCGQQLLAGRDPRGRELLFIPYHTWANRGDSRMQVWVGALETTP